MLVLLKRTTPSNIAVYSFAGCRADEAQGGERGGGELLQRRGQRRPAERNAAGVLRAGVQALQGTFIEVRYLGKLTNS